MDITKFEVLEDKIREIDKNHDVAKIRAAYDLAVREHAGQVRKSGEPYVCHPIAVAQILLDMCMDTDTIVAALLHDIVEDTPVSLDELRRQFGGDVAALVDGVTKIGKIKLKTPGETDDKEGVPVMVTEEEQKNEEIRKILVAMSKDNRVIIIKLADRLHNIRTLGSLLAEKQRRIALETLNFYAPLAHRLGMANIKDELENTSLFYLDRFAYKEIENNLETHRQNRSDFIERIIAKITERLQYMKPAPIIQGRVKGIYSIYKKWYVSGRELEDIYDVFAFRVIVATTADCYTVLGEIHDLFTPLSGRFKDYISSPKINGYQSLHTTVLSRDRQPFEVQIRTHEMHTIARHGIAAHWQYKLGITVKNRAEKSRFEVIRDMLEHQQNAEDADSLAEIIRKELTSDEVHVFTPQGDAVSLMNGATVVDFAYAVHTEVGNKMKGAKVSGKQVSFNYELKTGDVVEIQTAGSDNHHYGPSRSWLDYAKTTRAKNKIRGWLKNERKEDNIASGRAFVDSIIRRDGVCATQEQLDALAKRHKFRDAEEMYAAIGYGGIDTARVVEWLNKDLQTKEAAHVISEIDIEKEREKEFRKRRSSTGVVISGYNDIQVRFASCCNPLPGDDIIGFITRSSGVTIHNTDCPNVIARQQGENAGEYAGKFIDAKWSESLRASYPASIEIISVDRMGLMAELSTIVTENHVLIINSSSRLLKNGNAIVNFTLEIANTEQLSRLVARLKKVHGVITVDRRTGA